MVVEGLFRSSRSCVQKLEVHILEQNQCSRHNLFPSILRLGAIADNLSPYQSRTQRRRHIPIVNFPAYCAEVPFNFEMHIQLAFV